LGRRRRRVSANKVLTPNRSLGCWVSEVGRSRPLQTRWMGLDRCSQSVPSAFVAVGLGLEDGSWCGWLVVRLDVECFGQQKKRLVQQIRGGNRKGGFEAAWRGWALSEWFCQGTVGRTVYTLGEECSKTVLLHNICRGDRIQTLSFFLRVALLQVQPWTLYRNPTVSIWTWGLEASSWASLEYASPHHRSTQTTEQECLQSSEPLGSHTRPSASSSPSLEVGADSPSFSGLRFTLPFRIRSVNASPAQSSRRQWTSSW